jgi:amino acid adenylation domain-containing protein
MPGWQDKSRKRNEVTAFVPFQKGEIEQSIQSRFEVQVLTFPDRIAVKSGKSVLTYRLLNEQSNRIARAITARVGCVQKPIAFLLAEDAKSIATMLGILKSGNFFVSLDPEHPRSRIARLMEDSQAALIVTDDENQAIAEELSGSFSILNYDGISCDTPSDNIGHSAGPDSLAYLVYTSGSTGQPKGLLHSHRNRLFRTMNTTNSLEICASDRVSLLSARTSAQALDNIFGALLNGATVCPFQTRNKGADSLAAWLVQEKVTIYHSTSSIFNHFIRTLNGNEQFPRLRVVRLGGESVTRREFDLFRKHFVPGCIFVHSLSASEVGNFRQYIADHRSQFSGNLVPTGYSVPEVEVLILDERGKPVATGELGEIAVRSRYLALEYWRKPELTRETFQPDPSGGDKRVYRTGDLGRLMEDGSLQYLGRKDFQVKIRGNRVEVAEIEMALLELPAIVEAAVVAAKNEHGDSFLVAYVVPSAEPMPAMAALRRALSERLPDYMVPARFEILDKLPRTPQGKIDRKALPAPCHTTNYVAPRTSIETRLVSYWQSTLGAERVGIRDDFFELGGNSLLAVRLLNIIEAEFGKRLPISTFYSATTVEALAELIPKPVCDTSLSPIIKIRDHGGRTPFFFLHAAYNGGGFYCLQLARHLGDDQPFYSLQPIGARNRTLPVSIEHMARMYVEILRKVQPNGPYCLGGYCSAGLIALEMAQQLRACGERVDFLCIIDIPAKNADMRIHRSLIGWAARILRLDRRRELDAFIRLRNVLYAYRALSGIERIKFVFERARKIAKALPNVVWKRFAPAVRRNPGMTGRLAEPIDVDGAGWEDLIPHYRRLWRGYVVRPYSGHITLLRTNDHKALENDTTLGWGRITADLEVYITPGDHNGCVMDPDNLAMLGQRLKACLDRRQVAPCNVD